MLSNMEQPWRSWNRPKTGDGARDYLIQVPHQFLKVYHCKKLTINSPSWNHTA